LVWPDNSYQLVKDFSTGKKLVITYKKENTQTASNIGEVINGLISDKKQFTYVDVKADTLGSVKPFETLDFNYYGLLPHGYFPHVPAMAVADVNNDGIEDLYIGGIAGEEKYLLAGGKDGKFTKVAVDAFTPSKELGDLNAVWLDANSDGLQDLMVVSASHPFFEVEKRNQPRLYINKGNFKFEDITATAQVAGTADWCSGVTMADVNGDGWLDIYVSAISGKFGLKGQNQLFINNKNATFTESAAAYGLDIESYAGQSAFFDYDHDGDLDCYVLNQSDRPYQNIVDTSNRRKYDPHAGDKLLRNDLNTGSKKFTDVSAQAGIYQSSLGYGLGIAVADLNNDGWDDIYIGNDFHENDYYYINNGN
ncbi:MAG: VCBS repeat-containing protein, partial [Pedobacter sp.]